MMELKMNIALILVINMFSYTWEKTLKDYPSECFTSREIDDNTRYFKNYKVPTSSADDLDLEKGWYRVIGRKANSMKQGFDKALAGNRRSPPNFCGTIYAGALMGEHPTPDQGIVEMTVCFRSSFCFYENIKSCVCKYKKIIYVRNCLRHYIYWLTPTNNQARYCTGNIRMDGPLTVENRSYAVECNQYSELGDNSRVWDRITDVKSDAMEGWYRFSKEAGTELASGCTVTSSHLISRMAQPCGAAYRGYMPDRHPSLADGRVSRRVCFSSATSCQCEFFTNIGVRNCGSFYVYRLQPPPIPNSRYCGASKELLSVNQDVKKPTIDKPKGICEQYEVRHDPDRLWSFTSPTVKKCDAHFYGRYRFGSKYTPWSIKEGCNKTDMYIVTHRCGTTYQGFMEGRHPTVSEGYVERIICFQEASSPCECANTTIIGVQNCSGFYVYDMKGVPRCDSRFCMVANKSAQIRIDPGRPPLYDIPLPGVKTDSLTDQSSNRGKSFITTTMLSICLLLVLIILIGFVLLLLFCIWPLYKDRKQGGKKYVKNNNIPSVNHHDHSESGSNGRLPREQITEVETDFVSDNNNEGFLDLTIPPRPANAPPIEQPFSPDLPPMPSDDEEDKCVKISPTSDISFPELPEEIKDEEHTDSEDYDTLLKKEDIHKPEPYSQFDSAV